MYWACAIALALWGELWSASRREDVEEDEAEGIPDGGSDGLERVDRGGADGGGEAAQTSSQLTSSSGTRDACDRLTHDGSGQGAATTMRKGEEEGREKLLGANGQASAARSVGQLAQQAGRAEGETELDLPTAISPSCTLSPLPLTLRMSVANALFPRKPITTPIRPDTVSFDSQSFHTLTREAAFSHPPTNKSDIPALDELVAPHIESFNALLEDSEGGGKGLLALAVDDIGAKVVFDGKKPGTGNRLSSQSKAHPYPQRSHRRREAHSCALCCL